MLKTCTARGLRGWSQPGVVADEGATAGRADDGSRLPNCLRGAWGFGSNLYFADNVSLLVGPVFFLDENLQPGGSKYLWTAQLDIDIPLGR